MPFGVQQTDSLRLLKNWWRDFRLQDFAEWYPSSVSAVLIKKARKDGNTIGRNNEIVNSTSRSPGSLIPATLLTLQGAAIHGGRYVSRRGIWFRAGYPTGNLRKQSCRLLAGEAPLATWGVAAFPECV